MNRDELLKCFPKKSNAGRDLDWRAFGTLSTHLPLDRAEKSMIRWFAEIRHAFFPDSINWVAVLERPRFHPLSRVHLLTDGFETCHRDKWTQRWKQLASGNAWLYSYRDRQDFVEYLDSEVEPTNCRQVEFDLNGSQSSGWKYPAMRKHTMKDRFENLFDVLRSSD